jgi:4-hydroxybenzoate polyprenyltransferase
MVAGSLVYVLNDVKDAGEDAAREDRKHRPVASGAVSKPAALLLAAALLAGLFLLVRVQHHHLWLLVSLYVGLNFAYTLGLKRHLGVQQAIVAAGFWLRLQSGGEPVAAIPVTPWAALFTLGLAYYLSCLKGLHAKQHDLHRPHRFAMGVGAALAGSLALAALVAICLKRGVEGTMRLPELPPLFCLVGLHRVAERSFGLEGRKEQALTFAADPVNLACMAGFLLAFLWH